MVPNRFRNEYHHDEIATSSQGKANCNDVRRCTKVCQFGYRGN